MRGGPTAAALALAIGVVVLMGCGRGGAGGAGAISGTSTASTPAPPSAPPLPRAKFISEARSLCTKQRLAAERKALWVWHSKAKLYERHGNLNQFAGSLRRQEINIVIVPSLRRRLKEVRELGIPTADRDRVEMILNTISHAIKVEEGFEYGVASGGPPIRHARAVAGSYGILSCAIPYKHEGVFMKGTVNPGPMPPHGAAR